MTGRSVVARRTVPPYVPAPVGGGVRRDPGDAVRLAPAPGQPQMGLRQPPTSRATVHGSRDPKACSPHRDGQSGLGTSPHAGELVKLGHSIAACTVWQILHDAEIVPAPRRTGPTCKQFLTTQARGILAADFAVDTVPLIREWSPARRAAANPRLVIVGSGCGRRCWVRRLAGG